MQKIGFVLGCLILLNWACGEKKTKEEAAAEVTIQTTEVMKSSEKIKQVQQEIQVKADLVGDKVNDLPDTANLTRVFKGRSRLDMGLEQGDQLTKDLQQLSADYAAGKVSSKEYEERYKTLQEAVRVYNESVDQAVQYLRNLMESADKN